MAAVAFASLALAAPEAGAALAGDRLISRDRAASDLSGYGELLVWSHRAAPGRHVLRLYRERSVEPLKTRSSREQMDADVGPGPGGRPAVVYRSCRPRCRLYMYSVESRRERRLPIAYPRRCDADYPAISGRAIVYSLSGDRCGRRAGVWVLSGHRLRQLARSDAGQMDLHAGTVIWTAFGNVINRIRSAKLTPGSPIITLFADGARCCGFNVIISNPTFDGDSTYWADWNDAGRRRDYHRVFRASGSRGDPCEASDVQFPSGTRTLNTGLPWIDFAVRQGRVSYITPQGIFERDSTGFSTAFSKYGASSRTAPFCGP